MLNRIKEFIKNHNFLASATKLVGTALFLGTLFYVGANAPQWHMHFIEHKVGRVVVKVVRDDSATSGGTGFHVKAKSGKSYILTNAHVCGVSADGKEALIQIPGTDRFIMRRIIEVYKKHDLCLIEGVIGYEGIEIADSVEPGSDLRVVGHPVLRPLRAALGTFLQESKITIMIGIVGANLKDEADCKAQQGYTKEVMDLFGPVTICLQDFQAMETTAVIYGGNSGSPAVNFFAKLVGVVFASDNRMNQGFLVPLRFVTDFLSIY